MRTLSVIKVSLGLALATGLILSLVKISHLEKDVATLKVETGQNTEQEEPQESEAKGSNSPDKSLLVWTQIKNLSLELSHRSTFLNKERTSTLQFPADEAEKVEILGWKMMPFSYEEEEPGKYKIEFHVYPRLKTTDGAYAETDGYVIEAWRYNLTIDKDIYNYDRWTFVNMIGKMPVKTILPATAELEEETALGKQPGEVDRDPIDKISMIMTQVQNLSPELGRKSTFLHTLRKKRLKFSAEGVEIIGWTMTRHSFQKEGSGKYKIKFHVYPRLEAVDGTLLETDGYIRETWRYEVTKAMEGWTFLFMTGKMPAKSLFLNGKRIRTL